MDQDLRDLLSACNVHKVFYLIVGGYAVSLHAEPRATKDLDILIRANEKNSELVFRALAQFGAPLAGYTVQDFMDQESGFQIGLPPARIDILQRLEGVAFDEVWDQRVEALIDGDLPAHFISRAHLIRNKLAFARPRHLLDVQALRDSDPETALTE